MLIAVDKLFLVFQLSDVMSKRGMNPTVSDLAIRLDLVAKAWGVVAAEESFVKLPESAKNHLTYGSLLNVYCKELMIDKAEALMKKMDELKFTPSAMSYNSMMTLYAKTNQPEKIPTIIQKMKTDDVLPDCFTYNVWMRGLAAVGDISGVDKVISEMKRDGRVTGDWTTYSNLASIYVSAGLFEKAEVALKELERRNNRKDLSAYQFLITLYGRTGNLKEVYRVWRSLKLAFRNTANISYLNMIQVLVNLEDLSGAETCFQEWQSQCSTYDIRVANVLMGTYLKHGRISDAEKIKKHARSQGAKPNAKTWELFMHYHINLKDMKSAVECIGHAIAAGRGNGKVWVPSSEALHSLMVYYEEKKDVQGAENVLTLLKKVDFQLGAELFEALIRIYVAVGAKSPGIRQRLKMENIVVGEDMEKLLEMVCEEE